MMLKRFLFAAAIAGSAAYLVGCNKAEEKGASVAATQVSDAGHEEGWWCDEHGVPEEVCARCNAKLVADFKAKGDWCKTHDCPESQCFICHPEKEAEFAALYEAKYGKQPPKPGTGEHEHDHHG
jgi:hypothetical protein